MTYKPYLLTILILIAPSWLLADVNLPAFFTDGMVLQRDAEVSIWGTADRRENIQLSFQGKDYTTQADRQGNWKITLPPTPAGGPHSITISGKNIINLRNILFGDVYLASGQSNMEWELYRLPEALQAAGEADEHPEIRIFTVAKSRAFTPQQDVAPGRWHTADSSQVLHFSAVAYYFARYLKHEINVPIGLIGSYWGGTAIETWMSREILDSLENYQKITAELSNERSTADKITSNYEKELSQWIEKSEQADPGYSGGWHFENYDHTSWPKMTLPAILKFAGLPTHNGSFWFRKQFFVPSSMQYNDLYLHLPRGNNYNKIWVNGEEIGGGQGSAYDVYQIPRKLLNERENSLTVRVFDTEYRGGISGQEEDFYITNREIRIPLSGKWNYQLGVSYEELPERPQPMLKGSTPTVIYNAMIAPLIPFTLRGVLWYQGEANTWQAYEYRKLFPMMIRDWRRRWQQPALPFLFVQLASYKQPQASPAPSDWAELREAQAMALDLPNTAMATAIDLGDAVNIHPNNKREVGRRLALAARKVIYEEDVVHSGPIYKSMEILGNQIMINFDTQGSPLTTPDPYGYLKGFSISRADRKFKKAKAYILNDTTAVVYNNAMINPVAVRYGWADNPHDMNLYNEDGLPALPFRTDDWPGTTYDVRRYSLMH